MKIIPVTDRAEWLEWRRKNVGASEASALFGCEPEYALSHFALWMTKAGRMNEPEVNSERAAWGLKLEKAIAEAAAEREGWTIADAGYCVHPTIAGMACTLDYLIVAGEEGRDDPGVLEIKNADWLIAKRRWTEDEPPIFILIQLQAQLACTGLGWGAVACLVGGNRLEIYRYEARAKVIEDIEKRVAAFWASIEQGKAPPIDGAKSTAAAVAKLFPRDDGEDQAIDMTADNELPDLCARQLHAVEAIHEGERIKRECDSGIVAILGEHRAAFCEGFTIKAAAVAEILPKTITPSMVGDEIGGRKGYRTVRIKEVT